MKHAYFLLMTLAVLLMAPAAVHAQAVKVIANPSISATSVSTSDLRDVFLENSDSLGGSHAQPVLEKGGPAHEAFLQKYLDKSDAALQNWYRSLIFSGKGSMPKTLESDAEVAAWVAKTKGAVGYVSADAPAPGTKNLDVR